MESIESSIGMGKPVVMITEGGNHPAALWGIETAKRIFDITEVNEADKPTADFTQYKIAALLEVRFEGMMMLFRNHDFILDLKEEVDTTIGYILQMANHPWIDKLKTEEWRAVATQEIGNMLATCIHIELDYKKGLNTQNS